MEHIAVSSSQIASIAHDSAGLTMQVLFRRGGLYEYSDVSPEEFAAVLNPTTQFNQSVGTAYAQLIKGRKPARKLEGQPWPAEKAKVVDWPAAVDAVSTEFPAEPAEMPAEVQTVSRKSQSLTEQASTLAVIDADSQIEASEALKAIAAMRREISDTFKPMKDAAFKAHRTVCQQEKMLDDPLAQAEATLKGRIGHFVGEQQRLAREAEEVARAEERRRADAEAAQFAQEQALEQAIDLEARGNTVAAEAVLANPAPVAPRYIAPAPVAPAVAQVKGVSTRTDWDFRITDISQIPRDYLLPNETAIRNLGKNTQGRAKVPGVEFFPKTVVATSRRG
jgi:hypothetical protein